MVNLVLLRKGLSQVGRIQARQSSWLNQPFKLISLHVKMFERERIWIPHQLVLISCSLSSTLKVSEPGLTEVTCLKLGQDSSLVPPKWDMVVPKKLNLFQMPALTWTFFSWPLIKKQPTNHKTACKHLAQ